MASILASSSRPPSAFGYRPAAAQKASHSDLYQSEASSRCAKQGAQPKCVPT